MEWDFQFFKSLSLIMQCQWFLRSYKYDDILNQFTYYDNLQNVKYMKPDASYGDILLELRKTGNKSCGTLPKEDICDVEKKRFFKEKR